MNRNLEVYLHLERIMLALEKTGDPLADHIRDLMDPVWRRLSEEDIRRLDERGIIGEAGLFPIQLPFPSAVDLAPATLVGAGFVSTSDRVGWRSNDDWNLKAA